MNNYIEVIQKYAVFSGRASRKEYWMFFLMNIIIGGCMGIVIGLIKGFTHLDLTILIHLYTLALLCPNIGVSVRRLHDTNRSGWWMLVGLVPLIGPIIVLVFMANEGTPADNNFGPNPNANAITMSTKAW